MKPLSLVAVVILLGNAYRRMNHDPRAALVTAAAWTTFGLACVVLLALFRNPVAHALSNAAVKYLTTDDPDQYGRGADFIRAWRSGWIVAAEAGLVVLLSVMHAAAGYFAGRLRFAAVGMSLLSVAVLAGYAAITQLFQIDWDNFHGDIFSGGLLLDVVVFVIPSDPNSAIGSLCYGGVAAGWVLLQLTVGEAAQPSPELVR